MIKVVVFDYGGVIGKEPHENEICSVVAKKFGLGHDFVKRNYNTLESLFITNKISKREFCRRLAKLFGVSSKELEKVWDVNYFHHRVKLNKQVVKIAKNVKKSGYEIALLSNVFPYRDTFLKKQGAYNVFRKIFLSSKVKLRKPDKRIYKLVIRKLQIKPNECVFIDDRKLNVNGAKKVGIKAILFRDSTQLKKDLKKYL